MADVSFHLTGEALWRRMNRAVEKIQERLEKTAGTLEKAGIPYAIIGGNAVRAWVAQADEALVRMKLNAYRRKDQMHLLDMIDVALVDESWCARFPPQLATRLKELLDDPDG